MFLVLFLLACGGKTMDFGDGDPTDLSGVIDPDIIHPSCLDDEGLILNTPDSGDYSRFEQEGFSRYTQIVAPNGGVIPIFAQSDISEAQLIRARNVLRFFLTDSEGSLRGDDKSAVANSMADNGAALMMPSGSHHEGNEPNINAQPLYFSEMPVEGGVWFMNNDFNHRDAGFEEIFHLVHDAGIGTYMPGALPNYQMELDSEARAALADGRWGIPVDPSVQDWIEELEQEDSLAQEYIASVIDSYYGLWGPWDEGDGGMWGLYIAKTRADVQELDPAGAQLLLDFLSQDIHTEFRLVNSLSDDFDMAFDSALPYTHKSQYFKSITLMGQNPISLFGNAQDNFLRGNDAGNTIDGREGEDTMIYCSNQRDYSVSEMEEVITVNGPEGEDTLHNIEWLHFADGRVSAEDFWEN